MVVFFYQNGQAYDVFSNVTSVPVTFVLDGNIYNNAPSSESIYQAAKAPEHPNAQGILQPNAAPNAHGVHLPDNQAMFHNRDNVLTAPAGVQHYMGNLYVKEALMEQILLAKATQHKGILKALFETGNQPIVENTMTPGAKGSPDALSFWGNKIQQNGQAGRNALGQAWERVRSILWQELQQNGQIRVRQGISDDLAQKLGYRNHVPNSQYSNQLIGVAELGSIPACTTVAQLHQYEQGIRGNVPNQHVAQPTPPPFNTSQINLVFKGAKVNNKIDMSLVRSIQQNLEKLISPHDYHNVTIIVKNGWNNNGKGAPTGFGVLQIESRGRSLSVALNAMGVTVSGGGPAYSKHYGPGSLPAFAQQLQDQVGKAATQQTVTSPSLSKPFNPKHQVSPIPVQQSFPAATIVRVPHQIMNGKKIATYETDAFDANELLAFLRDERRLSSEIRMTHSQLLKQFESEIVVSNPGLMESAHSYIQTLFPIPEEGAAPSVLISRKRAQELGNNPEVQQAMIKHFAIFMRFMGLQWNPTDNSLMKLDSKLWQNWLDNSHNNLRLTRIIKSMDNFGFPDVAKAFAGFLDNEAQKTNSDIVNGQVFKPLTQEAINSNHSFWQPTAARIAASIKPIWSAAIQPQKATEISWGEKIRPKESAELFFHADGQAKFGHSIGKRLQEVMGVSPEPGVVYDTNSKEIGFYCWTQGNKDKIANSLFEKGYELRVYPPNPDPKKTRYFVSIIPNAKHTSYSFLKDLGFTETQVHKLAHSVVGKEVNFPEIVRNPSLGYSIS